MPSVISKYLDETTRKYNIPKEYVTRGIVAALVVSYGCKITYPLLINACSRTKKSKSSSLCNGNVLSRCNNSDSEDEKIINNNKLAIPNGNVQKGKKVVIKEPVVNKEVNKFKSPGFNKEFIIQLYKLIRLMIPSVCCVETGLLAVHTLALITRTFMSIYVASMEGRMVKFIVKRDVNNFALMLLKWLGVALPATFLNSTIRYLENKIALSFR